MEHFGNASSIHLHGQQAHRAVETARERVAAFFNCREGEVIFNSGGTEGANTALFGVLKPGDHLITTAIEHSAVLRAADRLTGHDVAVTFVAPEPNSRINPAAIRAALRPNTRLISVMLANNETGVLEPAEEIAAIAAEAGALFHIDAVQAAGKIPLDVARLNCHLLSISAHKFHGPKGVGALYLRKGTHIDSLLVGGTHEGRRRAGTENVPGIVGMGKAIELAQNALADGTLDRVAALRDRLEAGILQIPGTRVHGSGAPRTANTTNIGFESVDGGALVIALDLKGVAVSAGSACASGNTRPSHVLLAMGLDESSARASLRFSLLKTATPEDVDYVLAVLPEAVAHLRELTTAAAR
jgi:cysteine desulfurase